MAGFENYLAQMIIKPRQCVLCKNHVAMSKVKFTVRTYSLCIGLNETYLCPAYTFVVGPASGMVGYKNLVFHPFVRPHQGTILLKALGGGISVLWTHFFSSYKGECFGDFLFTSIDNKTSKMGLFIMERISLLSRSTHKGKTLLLFEIFFPLRIDTHRERRQK